jgi:hypothetical protein
MFSAFAGFGVHIKGTLMLFIPEDGCILFELGVRKTCADER